MRDADRQLRALAAASESLVTRAQAHECGLDWQDIYRRTSSGVWIADGNQVLRLAGAPQTRKQRVLRAVLDAGPGAFLCDTSGAAWWGLPGYDLRVLHATRPRGISGSPAQFAVLHEVLDLQADHVTVLDGIPIVRPERLIFELCGSVHPGRAERALDAAWSRGLLSGDSLRRVHAELAKRGRKGTVVLRELLEARPPGYIPPASNLEARFAKIVADAGLPQMRRQVNVGCDRWTGRVDFLAEDRPFIVEVQSERYHKALSDARDDALRHGQLRKDGFVVVEVWDVEIWFDPAAVVRKIRKALLAVDLSRFTRQIDCKFS